MILATTTVTILRPPAGDQYVPGQDPKKIASIAAHISAPSGADLHVGGEQSQVDAVLLADPACHVEFTDLIRDETTCDTYSISWLRVRRGLGLDHLKAGLRHVEGAANG